MFYPQKMTQIRLIIPSRDLLSVTRELANQAIFHQTETRVPGPEKGKDASNSWHERGAAYSALERRIMGIMQALGIEEGPLPTVADGESMVDIDAVQPPVDQVDQEVKKAREQQAVEDKRLEQLNGLLNQLEPIAGVNIDLDMMRRPEYIHSIMGVMPTPNIDRLRTSLERIPFVFFTLREDPQRAVVWLAGMKRNADVLDRAVRAAYLNPLALPESYQGTPAQIIQSIRADIQTAQQHIADTQQTLRHLAQEWKQRLQTLLWQVRVSRILAEAMGRFGQFRYTYIIDGWVPSAKLPSFERRIQERAPGIVVETRNTSRSDTQENIPVALNNPRLLRPFQSFVTNYAEPRYQELDPTFFLAIMFPFLFGAMFGDVGQGIVLTLLGLLIVSRRVKALNMLGGLGGIIAACGISATIFGFLYGSIFGFEHILPALILRPLDNILTTLSLAILIGVVLLSIGYILSMLNAWTVQNWGHLIVDPHGLAGLVLYWSLVGLALEVMTGKYIIPLAAFGILALLTGLTVMFSEVLRELIEGHRPEFEGGLPTYVFRSFFELFETLISLLSNSVSFVRVGAFAVAHVGLTEVIFILAGLVDAGHGIGYVIALIIGNLFIIGFEGMIVGIQTMRLSYYEFFSKFFSGGGIRYEPLTLQPKADQH